MAKKSSKTDFRSIVTAIRKKEFAPVYLLMGEETYYVDKLVELLEATVVPEDERDFNYSVVYGKDANIADIIASCQQYPFMADRRAVFFKEAQTIEGGKNTIDQLTSYIERPNEQCTLVVSFKGDSLNATSRLMKAAAASDKVVVYKSDALREWEVSAPILEYCREKKIAIGEDSINILKEYIGFDLSKLFGAIDKLIVSVDITNGRITPELIERNIGISKDYNNFELINALAMKNYDKCIRIITYFESNPTKNPTIKTTGLLYGFFSKLLSAQMSQNRSEAGLREAVGAKSDYAFRDYRNALSRYNAVQSINAIHLIRQFDIQSKGVGSFQNEFGLLKELIFNIFAGMPLQAQIATKR